MYILFVCDEVYFIGLVDHILRIDVTASYVSNSEERRGAIEILLCC